VKERSCFDAAPGGRPSLDSSSREGWIVDLHGKRGEEWRQILGMQSRWATEKGVRLPVERPIPMSASLPDRPHSEVYMLDLMQLSTHELETIAEHLARKFNLTLSDVQDGVIHQGIPILAEDCIGPAIPLRLLL